MTLVVVVVVGGSVVVVVVVVVVGGATSGKIIKTHKQLLFSFASIKNHLMI